MRTQRGYNGVPIGQQIKLQHLIIWESSSSLSKEWRNLQIRVPIFHQWNIVATSIITKIFTTQSSSGYNKDVIVSRTIQCQNNRSFSPFWAQGSAGTCTILPEISLKSITIDLSDLRLERFVPSSLRLVWNWSLTNFSARGLCTIQPSISLGPTSMQPISILDRLQGNLIRFMQSCHYFR